MKKRVLCCLLMLCMVITMAPTMAWAGEEDPETPEAGNDTSAVTLDIADGSITITETSYTQGSATETWDDSNSNHEIIITGTATTANTITVNGGDPTLIFKALNVTRNNNVSSRTPVITVTSDATIKLDGKNTIDSSNATNNDGKTRHNIISIGNNATLTVTSENDGALYIKSSTNTDPIVGKGTFVLEKGTVDLNNVITPANITVKGGLLKVSCTASSGSVAIRTTNLKVEGGRLEATGRGSSVSATNFSISDGICKLIASSGNPDLIVNSSCSISGGTLDFDMATINGTTSITGGNINSVPIEDTGRTLTGLCFANEDGTLLANTEVTVTEGDNTWTALTNEKGVVITYLASETGSITVSYGNVSEKIITLDNKYNKYLIGTTCTCEETPGTLSISADGQELLISDDSQKVNLSAAYTKENCKAPDTFHGEYEEISFEVLRVEKNGKYVNKDTYTSIEGNSLSVYYDEGGDDYTVYVRALSGMEDHEAYSEPLAINVHSLKSSNLPLNIANGSITITDAGYKQGETGEIISWGAEEAHELTITGTATTANTITVNGGNPTLTFKALNVTRNNHVSSKTPVITVNSDATIKLDGKNTIDSSNATNNDGKTRHNLIKIGKDKKLFVTSENNGTLVMKGSTNTNAITGDSGSTFVLKAGTVDINSQISPKIIKIEDGLLTVSHIGNSGHVAIVTTDLTISGGCLEAQGEANSVKTDNFSISDGICKLIAGSGNPDLIVKKSCSISGGKLDFDIADITGTTSITGGNINDISAIEDGSRTRTALYFVKEDGTSLPNTEVKVKEGGLTWTALTSENGAITTYFANGASSIEVSYGDVEQKTVALSSDDHQYLIGGVCTCGSAEDITWKHGLPDSVNMYETEDSVYAVADAVATIDYICNMPIHPNMPKIMYGISVEKDEATVDGSNVSQYASLENGSLTLKSVNAPYTVTLTAKVGDGAGEKKVSHTINVNKRIASSDTTSINLSQGNVVINYADPAYSYTQGENTDVTSTENILLIGTAKEAKVTVRSGSPVFTFNQNTANNVWKVFAEESAGTISLDLRGVSGKVRFGLDGLKDGQLSYISSEAVKLNPENGSITFNADGSVTQGKFTITGINDAKVSVIGASKEEATTVTNDTDAALKLKINGRDVTLAAGESYTVKKAVSSYNASANGEIWAYVLESDQPLYQYNITYLGNEGSQYAPEDRDEYIAIYGLSDYVAELTQATVQGYELITAGEGTVKKYNRDNYENSNLDYRNRIIRVYLDPEITKLSGGFFYAMNALDEADMYYLKSMSGDLWGAGIRKLNIGPYLDGSGVANNFMRYLRSITVDEANPSFMTDDGVLYSKDGKTLLLCPAWKTGGYKILDTCETIGGSAFYGTHLNVLTINAKLSSIASTRTFEDENNLYFKVAYGNQYFSAVNGALYTADGKELIKLPYGAAKANGGEYEIPEGVTSVANYGIQNNYLLKKLTLPSTLSSQGGYLLDACNVLEELIVNTIWDYYSPTSKVLRKVTVIEDYPFSTTAMFTNTSMSWVKGNITVSAEDCLYDGKAHSVTVTSKGNTVEYSTDGAAWSAEAPEYTQPGTYTVYWRVTKAAGDDYAFAREVYSQKTFTISEIEASEDWFALNPLGTTTSKESPVTLSQPAGSPSLEDGYTVLYRKTDGTGESTAVLPTEAGEYIVEVKITAGGYIEDTLTLGVYTVKETVNNEVVLSFITNGGSLISPVIANSGSEISAPADPTKTGYTFAGWYFDSALRTKATIPTTMPDANATYYAKWTRDEYSITYNFDADSDKVTADNPSTYNVETPTFTLKAPVRAGYTFLGWKENGEGEPLTSVTIEKGVTVGNKSYTAVWEEKSYTITENGDGSVTITEGQTTTTIIPPAGGKVVVGDDGVITAPAGTEIVKKEDDGQGQTTTTVTLPSGGTVDANNETVSSEKGSVITENPDGTVTIVNGENTTTVTPPEGETITVSKGEVILPAGSTVEQSENGQTSTTTVPDSVASITVPSGIIDEVAGDEGNISLPGGTVVTGKGDNAGSATIPDIVGSVTVPENSLGGITADDNGAVNLPEGTVITNGKGNNQTVITVPEGGQVNGKGTASSETGSVITENTNGTVTVTDKSGNTTTIKPSGDGKVTVSTDGKITVPSGSTVNGVEIPESTDSVTIPADKVGQVEEKDGALSLPSGSTVTTDGKDTVLNNGGTITEDGTVIKKPSSVGGGGALPPAQKPVIDNNDNVKTELSSDGTKLTIKAEEGYRVVDVIVNGVSKGAVDTLTGLKTGDKVVVVTEKIEDPDAEQAKIERIIKGVEATTLKARSSKTAKGIKITWTKSYGYKVDYYVIYRSTKKNSGYGTKPFYTTKSSTKCYYINTKDLKRGTKYYYKVRGVRVIDGQKYYTEWSGKAIRTW